MNNNELKKVGLKNCNSCCFNDIIKGTLSLGKMNGNFAVKFIWGCMFLFVYCLAGKRFLYKIVKMNLTN